MALTNRLLSERMVLLYSPSGVGKSSLLSAASGLRERMKEKEDLLLPTVRVSHAAGIAARYGVDENKNPRVNRYLLSTLLSLLGTDGGATNESLAKEIAQLGTALPDGPAVPTVDPIRG